jgi:hypothetical protein
VSSSSIIFNGAQLAAVVERSIREDASGADERGALGLLMRLQSAPVRPSRDLTPRGELERRDLVAGQATPQLVVAQGATSRNPNSTSRRSPQRTCGGTIRPTIRARP